MSENNNFNNQQPPQYQQPQYQPPQQPYYPQQAYVPAPSFLDKIYGKDHGPFDSLLKVLSIILFVLSAISVLLWFVIGVINSAGLYSGAFTIFITYVSTGIFHASIYTFFGVCLIAVKRLLNK